MTLIAILETVTYSLPFILADLFQAEGYIVRIFPNLITLVASELQGVKVVVVPLAHSEVISAALLVDDLVLKGVSVLILSAVELPQAEFLGHTIRVLMIPCDVQTILDNVEELVKQ